MKLPAVETVVCDRLSLTVPRADGQARRAVVGELARLGAECIQREEESELYRCGAGTYRLRAVGKVWAHDLSGQLLAELREARVLVGTCRALAMVPRLRVTGLDLARDVSEPGWQVIPALVRRHRRAGGLRVGRKRVRAGEEDWRNRLDPEGRESGSLYLPVLGKRRALRAVVYDKRAQVVELGEPDPGPLTRTELRCRGESVGMTLRDVVAPEALFFAKLGELVTVPAQAPRWRRAELPGRWPSEEVMVSESVAGMLRRIRLQVGVAAELAAEDPRVLAELEREVSELVAEEIAAVRARAVEARRGSGSSEACEDGTVVPIRAAR